MIVNFEILNSMTVKELRNYVKQNDLKISKFYELRKSDLIDAILNSSIVEESTSAEESESENDCEVSSKKNGWEEIATKNITSAYNWIVGENENTLQDEYEDSSEYQAAYNYLHGSEIISDIYNSAMSNEYDDGYCGYGKSPKEMRFAGKEFCMNLIKDLLKRDGYYSEDDSTEDSVKELSDSERSSFEESKENAKSIPRKLRTRVRYVCPSCGESAKGQDDFCYNCGLLLNHDSERYDELYYSKTLNNSSSPRKKIIIKGKKKRVCPSCNRKIWKGDNFCIYCGQEVTDND